MSSSRPSTQPYHFQADLIWCDGTLNASFPSATSLFYAFLPLLPLFACLAPPPPLPPPVYLPSPSSAFLTLFMTPFRPSPYLYLSSLPPPPMQAAEP